MLTMLKNWKVVVLSLVGATTFWFFNALNKSYDANITYPIEFVFNRDSVVVMKPLPENIRMNVSSGGWNLLRKTYWFNLPPIEIELSNPTSVQYMDRGLLFPIVVNQMTELRVNYIVNDSLFIDIEEKRTKKVHLKIDSAKISLEPLHRITSRISILPDSVELTGPKSFIDTIGNNYFISLDERSIDDPIDLNTSVASGNQLISSRPAEVRVSFNVERFYKESIMVPISYAGFPADSSKYPEIPVITVNYLISRSLRKEYYPSDFIVAADLSMMDMTDSTVTAMLIYAPPEVTDPSLDPSRIKIIYD